MTDSNATCLPVSLVQDPAQTASADKTAVEPAGPSPYDVPAVTGRPDVETESTALTTSQQTKVAPMPGNGRDANGRLMKGHHGVPGSGRPKGLAARVRQLVNFDKAIETLQEIAWGRLAPSARMADRIKAIEILFDRGHGRPQVTVDIKEGSSTNRERVRAMSFGELMAAVEGMRQLAEPKTDDDVEDAEEVQ